MTTQAVTKTLRWGNLTNIPGGILVAMAYVLHPHHADAEVVGGSFWLMVHLMFAGSLLFGIFGLISMIGRHIQPGGPIGLIGFILATSGLILIFGLNYFEAFINPVVAVEASGFVDKYGAGETIGVVGLVFPISGLLFMVGYGMLCTDIIRHHTLSVGAPSLTLIGVLTFGLGLSGLLPMMVVQVGAVLFGTGLAWMGWRFWADGLTPGESQ